MADRYDSTNHHTAIPDFLPNTTQNKVEKLIRLITFVLAGIKISLTQVGQKTFPRQAENGAFGKVLADCSDRLTVVAVVVVHVGVARIEVEVPRVVRVVRVERTRPVVAVAASVVKLIVPAVASSGQEETL